MTAGAASNGDVRSLALRPDDEVARGNPSVIIDEHKGALVVASALAKEAAKIVRENGLSKRFGGGPREHVYVEGWLTISRVQQEEPHAKVDEVTRDPESGNEIIRAKGWLTDRHGRIVSEADGYCSTEEPNWRGKPFYARASMAQTRAIAKAMRLRHAWVMVMAGYAPTPAEEIEALEEAPPQHVAQAQKTANRQPTQNKPQSSSNQPSNQEEGYLSEIGIVEGETISLEGHGCSGCAVTEFHVKRASQKAKRPGTLYLECAGCGKFGGYASDVMKNYKLRQE